MAHTFNVKLTARELHVLSAIVDEHRDAMPRAQYIAWTAWRFRIPRDAAVTILRNIHVGLAKAKQRAKAKTGNCPFWLL